MRIRYLLIILLFLSQSQAREIISFRTTSNIIIDGIITLAEWRPDICQSNFIQMAHDKGALSRDVTKV